MRERKCRILRIIICIILSVIMTMINITGWLDITWAGEPNNSK